METTNELPEEWTTWSEKQRAAYLALKASFERNEKIRQERLGFSNGTPEGGWTDADRVPSR